MLWFLASHSEVRRLAHIARSLRRVPDPPALQCSFTQVVAMGGHGDERVGKRRYEDYAPEEDCRREADLRQKLEREKDDKAYRRREASPPSRG